MPIEFDPSIFKDIGIGGLAMFALWIFYKSFIFFIERWKESTDAINRNTETHENLSEVFRIFHEEHKAFERKIIGITEDTNKKVTDIHKDLRSGG